METHSTQNKESFLLHSTVALIHVSFPIRLNISRGFVGGINEWCIRWEPTVEEGSAPWSSSEINMCSVWPGWVPSSVPSPWAHLMKPVCHFTSWTVSFGHPTSTSRLLCPKLTSAYYTHLLLRHSLAAIGTTTQPSSNPALCGHSRLFPLCHSTHSVI